MKFGALFAARGNGFAIALVALVSALAVACGSIPSDSSASQMPVEAAAGSLTTILATKDLRVGTQRVSFLLATSSPWSNLPPRPSPRDGPTETVRWSNPK